MWTIINLFICISIQYHNHEACPIKCPAHIRVYIITQLARCVTHSITTLTFKHELTSGHFEENFYLCLNNIGIYIYAFVFLNHPAHFKQRVSFCVGKICIIYQRSR